MKILVMILSVLGAFSSHALGQSACVQQAVLDLTANQIAHLNSVPLEIVPAPGSGKALLYLNSTGQIKNSSIPFIVNSNVYIHYTGDDTNLSTDSFYVGGPDSLFSMAVNIGTINVPRVNSENKGLSLVVGADDLSGAMNSVTCPLDGGSGYAVNDTFSVGSDGGDTDGTGIVDAVSGGVVTACHITGNGYGYLTGSHNTNSTSGGGDNALSVDILTTTPANGTARVWINYQVLTLP
jgi:hypothetical protein